MVNNILFYNKKVCDFRMPQGVLNIGEHQEAIDRKYIIFILNAVILFEIELLHFTVRNRVVISVQSTNKFF